VRTSAGPATRGGPVAGEVTLTADAARYLVDETSVRLIGVDVPSIESGVADFPAHRLLLGASPPVLILEGIDLAEVPAGDYELVCLPLRWREAEGCPARAVLRR
jgi:arylformamidase